MPLASTSLTSWAKAIKKALDRAGCDGQALLQAAGLELSALDDPDARYPMEKTARLWQLAVEATGDANFGLKVASQVSQATFHALGPTLSVSATLGEAFDRIVRYFRLVSDAAELDFRQQGTEYHFTMHVSTGHAKPATEALDAFTSLLIRSCRSLAGREFAPLRIEFQRPKPANRAEFDHLLRAPLLFGMDKNRIIFDAADMEKPLEGANPGLARFFDEIASKYLARFDQENILARVKVTLIEQLSNGEPDQEEVATSLGMSARSLQRKLAEELTTYSEILDNTRHELALSYLKMPGYTVAEITYLLGFSDTSSFSRAFRRWTGIPPAQYQRMQPGEKKALGAGASGQDFGVQGHAGWDGAT